MIMCYRKAIEICIQFCWPSILLRMQESDRPVVYRRQKERAAGKMYMRKIRHRRNHSPETVNGASNFTNKKHIRSLRFCHPIRYLFGAIECIHAQTYCDFVNVTQKFKSVYALSVDTYLHIKKRMFKPFFCLLFRPHSPHWSRHYVKITIAPFPIKRKI